MQSVDLVPGTVARYNETTSRWFIAVVRKILGTDVELEFLSGDQTTVPIKKVETFLGLQLMV